MGSVSLAVVIHTFVKSVGPAAGCAAIIGLAILVLLFFAQARETRTLRDALEHADDQLGALESQIAALSHTQAAITQQAQARQPAQPPVVVRPLGTAAASVRQAPAAIPRPAPLPGAPAGVGAPALAAATRLIPLPAALPVPAAAVPTPAGVAVAAAGAVPVASAVIGAGPGGGPPPATVAGGGNGHGPGTAVPPPVPAGPPGRVQLRPDGVGEPVEAPVAPPVPTPPPPAAAVPAGPVRSAPPARPPARGRGERPLAGRLVPWLIGLVAVGVAVVALVIVTGGVNHHHKRKPSQVQAAKSGHHARGGRSKPAPFKPGNVTVAVLNGTNINGLAGLVGNELTHLGYQVPSSLVTNAANQTQTTTVVSYLSGFKSDAQHVARALKLKPSAVQPIDQETLQVACPGTASCTANVVATIGQDLASLATSTNSTT
jgi:LytR cell envelope-related transcriptional attenuator